MAFAVLVILAAVAGLFTGQPVVVVLGPVFAAAAVLRAFFAQRRVLAARRTGWRAAKITLSRRGVRGEFAIVEVRFAEDSRIILSSRPGGFAMARLADLPRLRAIVAGYGPAMTVLVLEDPPLCAKPVLFGASAVTYRWRPGP
ncbi:hypothetical protein [Amycolatopsis sp. NPDC004378]